jgi:hypothetical protein
MQIGIVAIQTWRIRHRATLAVATGGISCRAVSTLTEIDDLIAANRMTVVLGQHSDE